MNKVLGLSSLPTNGVVCGVEEDENDSNVVRMFVEYRGKVVDDMIIGTKHTPNPPNYNVFKTSKNSKIFIVTFRGVYYER